VKAPDDRTSFPRPHGADRAALLNAGGLTPRIATVARALPTILVVLLIVAFMGPGSSAGPKTSRVAVTLRSARSWSIRSIDTMAWSKDHLYGQIQASVIYGLLATDRSAGANTVAIEVPYDSASSYSPPVTPGYEATWVDTAHALGLHVWFRSQWNNWQGDYGFAKETPATNPGRQLGTAGAVLAGKEADSYLGLTYRWILSNPEYFRSGDIFTPAAEPDNAGVEPYCTSECMFSSADLFNQWLQDSMTVARAAFTSEHVDVRVGYWGISGWNATHGLLTRATVEDMGILAVDDYFKSPRALQANLASIESTYHVPLVVGEWGDIWDGGDQSVMVPEIDSIMSSVARLAYVQGFNYWRDIGESQGEGIVDPTTLQLNLAGLEVSHWFHVMGGDEGQGAA